MNSITYTQYSCYSTEYPDLQNVMNIKYSSPIKLRWRGLSCSCNATSDLTKKDIYIYIYISNGVHVTAAQTLTDLNPMGDRNMYDNSGWF